MEIPFFSTGKGPTSLQCGYRQELYGTKWECRLQALLARKKRRARLQTSVRAFGAFRFLAPGRRTTGSRIDFDFVAFFNEDRDLDFSTGLYRRSFQDAP